MKNINDLELTRKKYIIFDMDGTLIDSIGVWNITDQKLIEEYAGLSMGTLFFDNIKKIRTKGSNKLFFGAIVVVIYNFFSFND